MSCQAWWWETVSVDVYYMLMSVLCDVRTRTAVACTLVSRMLASLHSRETERSRSSDGEWFWDDVVVVVVCGNTHLAVWSSDGEWFWDVVVVVVCGTTHLAVWSDDVCVSCRAAITKLTFEGKVFIVHVTANEASHCLGCLGVCMWSTSTRSLCLSRCAYVKSYMGFRLVPKSVTLNDLERRNGHYFALFRRIR